LQAVAPAQVVRDLIAAGKPVSDHDPIVIQCRLQ
jgi:hypothetical protein